MAVKNNEIYTIPMHELEARVAKVMTLINELKALLPGLEPMTDEERLYSQGRFREGESQALLSVLDVVKHAPVLFQSLADQDEGFDPNQLEVDLIADRLQRRELFLKITEALEPIQQGSNDVALYLGSLSKPILLAAYRIAKVLSATDKIVRDKLAPALNFYGQIGKLSAAARSKNKEA